MCEVVYKLKFLKVEKVDQERCSFIKVLVSFGRMFLECNRHLQHANRRFVSVRDPWNSRPDYYSRNPTIFSILGIYRLFSQFCEFTDYFGDFWPKSSILGVFLVKNKYFMETKFFSMTTNWQEKNHFLHNDINSNVSLRSVCVFVASDDLCWKFSNSCKF